jgi:hypothetical protein
VKEKRGAEKSFSPSFLRVQDFSEGKFECKKKSKCGV